jgi:transposase
MRSKLERHSEEAEKAVRDIWRATRRQYSPQEKVRIVIAGLRGEDSIPKLCRISSRKHSAQESRRAFRRRIESDSSSGH